MQPQEKSVSTSPATCSDQAAVEQVFEWIAKGHTEADIVEAVHAQSAGRRQETVRARDVARRRAATATTKDVSIPPCADPVRRADLEQDDAAWLRYYCHELFTYDFTAQQVEMHHAIDHAITYGGDQAIAASRGEGKTKLFERETMKKTLQGVIGFALLLAATGSKAEDSLASIKRELETNERLLADYPEVCFPIRALEHTPNRAHYQTVSGRRIDTGEPYIRHPSRFKWCGQEVYLPDVPGAPAAGGIIATRGLDAEVRGLNKRDRRVDLVGIDDPDTEETVRSEDQAHKLMDRIDRAIAGLGGQRSHVARVMLTTCQSRKSVSFIYTDRKQKPSWQGKRFRFLVKKPDREDLWAEYLSLWRTGFEQTPPDEFARKAHQFYLDHREEMDAGAEVSNPNRHDARHLEDGSQFELSALQHYYNVVARLGQEAADCELDNNPPEETGPQESGITAYRIQRQLSGFRRKIVPPGTIALTQGIDCHKRLLYFVVRAWRADATAYTIDYGGAEVFAGGPRDDDGLDEAIKNALADRRDMVDADPYTREDGEIVPLDQTLIDAGYRTEAIYDYCRAAGLGFRPAMGFGKSAGCASPNFRAPVRSSPDKRVGDRWFLARQPKGVWLVCHHADHWKAWEHDRWMSRPPKPGSMTLWGQPSNHPDQLSDDEKAHFNYAKHLTAEVEVEEVVKGIAKRYFEAKSDTNHYCDASVLADVAASIVGVRLMGQPRPAAPTPEWSEEETPADDQAESSQSEEHPVPLPPPTSLGRWETL
ncbi:MAG: phage terminase large subunit family protein [Phycisphaerae bacterium]|nr:phage terminase large subunit family protein [Phycisphaerae bacterium]